MSRLYITLLAIAAFMISAIGATFSIAGLTTLFAGKAYTIGLMAGSLEFAKLVTAGFLYRYWGHVNRLMRTYLSVAVVTLSVITSMGIFGYLSNAYQKSTLTLKMKQKKIDALKQEDVRLSEEIAKIEKFIESIPARRISKKIALYESSRDQISDLNRSSEVLNGKIHAAELDIISTQSEVGPIVYVAEAAHSDVDTVARFLILVFVMVFDPLAICLVFAWNLAVRLSEKYNGNEARIASLALSKPVDHRFKKRA